MKRIWLAAGMSAAMVVLCAVLLGSAAKITGEITGMLNGLDGAKPGDAAVQSMIDRVHDRWEQCEGSLSAHVRHSEIEEVTYALRKIKSCWQTGEYELFVMACDEAKVAVEHLWEGSRLSLRNIL